MKRWIIALLTVNIVFSSFLFYVSAESLVIFDETEDPKIITSVAQEKDFTDDQVLVSLKKNYSKKNKKYKGTDFLDVEIEKIEDLTQCTDYGDLTDDKSFRQILCLTLKNKGKENVVNAIKKLEKLPMVQCVEPNYILKMDSSVFDVSSSNIQPMASSNDAYYQYSHVSIKSSDAWNFTTGISSIKVGVVDTGINVDHEDLYENMDVSLCRNFTDDGLGNVSYIDSHGTHVAGIVGAVGNNEKGISGICWDVTLISLRIFKKDPNDSTKVITTFKWIADAINYAKNNGIPIINCSFSGPGDDSTVKNAINNYSGLIVCSAGNGKDHDNNQNTPNIPVNTDNEPYYPGSYEHDNIISVMSIDSSGNIASNSNYGVVSVDIAAPGVSIWSTVPNNSYGYMSGTSMAAPQVAGVAALLKSYKPSLTTAQLKAAIMDGATSKSALKDKCVSGGMLNAYGALQRVTGKLKNYYTEVKIASNSNLSMLSCRVVYNTSKVYHTWSAFGPAAANNNLPLDIEPGKVAFFRSPNTSALTASGVLFKSKFSMPASNTLYTADLRFEKISPPTNSYVSMQKYLIGDINGDGTIDSADSLLAMQYSVGTASLTDMQKVRADVNFDGSINSTDSMMINQYGVDVIRTFW